MFQFQTMTTKRRRDDDSDSEDEPNLKKSRPLYFAPLSHGYAQSPLHINVRPALPPSPPATSHANTVMSAHEQTQAHAWGGPVQSSQWTGPDLDYSMGMDMDEDDSQSDIRSQPPESPFGGQFFRPPTLNPSSSLLSDHSTGRIPTPIHPTFSRGGMNGLGYPTSGSAGSMANNSSTIPPLPGLTVRKNRQDPTDRRRMPSPISEDEDLPDTPTAITQSQLSRLSFSQPSTDEMDMEAAPPLALPPTPKGRKRSGALTGTPGRFSMGYRDDCEKCRLRVPGHYSHFLP